MTVVLMSVKILKETSLGSKLEFILVASKMYCENFEVCKLLKHIMIDYLNVNGKADDG